MCWYMREIIQTILELTQRKFRWYIQIIPIAPGGENNQPYQNYSFRQPQVKKYACSKTITV